MPSNTNTQPDQKSDKQILKEGGYTGMNHFMQSYGLKIWNDDDVQEAKEIIKGFRAIDEQNARAEEQKNKTESLDATDLSNLRQAGLDIRIALAAVL
jgi:hypothetical protein